MLQWFWSYFKPKCWRQHLKLTCCKVCSLLGDLLFTSHRSPVLFPSQRSLPVPSTWLQTSSWPATWSTQSSRSSTRITTINSATRSLSVSWRTGCTAAVGWDITIYIPSSICLYWRWQKTWPLSPPPSSASHSVDEKESSTEVLVFELRAALADVKDTSTVSLCQLLLNV